jgi:hypothetical protein
MTSVTIGLIMFGCLFGGAFLGMFLRSVLPKDHLSSQATDVVKLGMGVIGTMGAILLGLLVASAKNTYDTQRNALALMSAKIVLLDRLLAHYGSEAKEVRDLLRSAVVRILNQTWPDDTSRAAQLDPTVAQGEVVFDKMQALVPQNDTQRSLKSQALNIITDLAQTRWLMFAHSGGSISMPVVGVVVLWFTILFVSFGLYGPPNPIVIATLFICAIAVSGALFLVLDLDSPFEGILQISSAPLRNAIAHLGR